MQAGREEIMAAGEDPAEMHSALKNLPILGHLTTEELAQQAIALFKRAPLEKLLRHCDIEMHWCTTPPENKHAVSRSVSCECLILWQRRRHCRALLRTA